MRPLSEDRLRAVLAWVVVVLIGGPVLGAVLLGVLHGDSPCILCWAERIGMILIALVGLFVVRYGPRPRYLGMAVLIAVWGIYMSLRHSGLHAARDVGQGFSAPILGVHTYIWALVIYVIALAVIGVLLLFVREIAPDAVRPATAAAVAPPAGSRRDTSATAPAEGVREPGRVGRFATGLFVVVIAANALQAFASTGPPPWFGQGDPVRLSWNPKHWVWSFEELEPYYVSLRGSWTIPRPDARAADPDPARGPLAGLPVLAVTGWERIGPALNGAPSGLARDSASGRLLVTTDRYGVYLLDSMLARVLHHVVIDPGFSVDLTPLAGAAFLGDTLAVVSNDKSWVLLMPSVPAASDSEWRHFLVSDGHVGEVGIGRFQTVRAHQMYVLSLAFDRATQELITVSVPNPRHHQMVVSEFARSDMTLSSEFEPRLGAGQTLSGPSRSLADYLVTGATVAGGRLYAVSAAYSTLLVVDLGARTLVAAYAVPGLVHPVGVAARGSQLLVAQADGRIAVLARPSRGP
ncbi:MAG TPA: disulfide bond formation protein B [Gemmatimonadales bacterium]|nr:disulfide bond formation protein B [Gemmatimonadales bacterium]